MTDITGLAWLLVKSLIVFGMGLYVIFAFVIVRQEQLMEHVLEEVFEPVLRLMVLVHFIASLVVFGLALVLL